ncbi:MAG: helix-turn-helix transcriptional regulator [Candidatus Omnitrophica bacterium]|nr:helix-turn-helix transcriptional regulator [Candidatus Omnitrophota bacterium]
MPGQRDAHLSVSQQILKNNPRLFSLFDNTLHTDGNQKQKVSDKAFKLCIRIPLKFQLSRLYQARYHCPEQPQTLGQHIRRARVKANLLAKDLARMLNCHRTSVLNWENDRTAPTEENLLQLKEIFPDLRGQVIPR